MDSLVGIKIGDWLKLLKQNYFGVDPPYWHKAIAITLLSIRNSIHSKKEVRLFKDNVEQITIEKPPIFILGHWRSGTTFLQNIMSQDKQFAYPNIFQCKNPHTFLILEPHLIEYFNKMHSEERPMDNVRVSLQSPGEEEFALGVLCLHSPLLGWPFPRREKYYDRYLTFKNVSTTELEDWKMAFIYFLKKLTWRYERQLILKSPTNTARVKLLLELFPGAKFIHIHRNPYKVFQSTRVLYQKAVVTSHLQRVKMNNVDAKIIERYVEMYNSFFEERSLIPQENFIEIEFEELEKEPYKQIEKIYNHLHIPGFEKFKPQLLKYIRSISNYKKNKHPELDEKLKQQIAHNWQRSFSEWGYSI